MLRKNVPWKREEEKERKKERTRKKKERKGSIPFGHARKIELFPREEKSFLFFA